jgi:hypothetical protein
MSPLEGVVPPTPLPKELRELAAGDQRLNREAQVPMRPEEINLWER